MAYLNLLVGIAALAALILSVWQEIRHHLEQLRTQTKERVRHEDLRNALIRDALNQAQHARATNHVLSRWPNTPELRIPANLPANAPSSHVWNALKHTYLQLNPPAAEASQFARCYGGVVEIEAAIAELLSTSESRRPQDSVTSTEFNLILKVQRAATAAVVEARALATLFGTTEDKDFVKTYLE